MLVIGILDNQYAYYAALLAAHDAPTTKALKALSSLPEEVYATSGPEGEAPNPAPGRTSR